MTKLGDILTFLETLAPAELAESWDNTGLAIGSREQKVDTILVALDPFEGVADEAIALGADLLVTHHPLLFTPAQSITDDTAIGRTVLKLIRGNIAAWSGHTTLDIADGGVNDVLAGILGLQENAVIGQENLLRCGTVEPQSLDNFLATVKQALGTPVLRYADGGKPVYRVAVGGGACASEMADAIAAGCDTFVTSDVKYNQFWDARDQGLSIIDAGHFYTENPVCPVLVQKLRQAFPEVKVLLSKSHADCMKFF